MRCPVLLGWLFGCGGGEEPVVPITLPADPPAVDARPATSMVGTWRMIPDERNLRELRIIEAATSDQEAKKARLGDLTPQEQALFDDWSRRKGKEVDAKLQELKVLRSYVAEYTDAEVTLTFGEGERYGPVPYTVIGQTETDLALTFDPGLGNGVETHGIHFLSPTRATDTVTTADGRRFDPIDLVKRPDR